MTVPYPIRLTAMAIGMIVFFQYIGFISMAHGEQLTQQQADDIVINRELILDYQYYSDEIIGDQRVPRVRVYLDGLVLVYYPVYMKRAGYYTLTLTSEELQNLVDLIISEGFFQFNEQHYVKLISFVTIYYIKIAVQFWRN